VMAGDVVSSRSITERAAFRRQLEQVCRRVNKTFLEDMYADFRILKGIDEIEGVLLNASNCYGILDMILTEIYPHSMRFALVHDFIETAENSRDVSRMDGPAFHTASDVLKSLKKTGLVFAMRTDDELLDRAVAADVNLMMLLKKSWSRRQHEVYSKYRETGTQHEVAETLGITQQAVSGALRRSMWKEISGIEEDLQYVFRHLPVKNLAGSREDSYEQY